MFQKVKIKKALTELLSAVELNYFQKAWKVGTDDKVLKNRISFEIRKVVIKQH